CGRRRASLAKWEAGSVESQDGRPASRRPLSDCLPVGTQRPVGRGQSRSGYEISEAALDRFLARRAAAERVPERGLDERAHVPRAPTGRDEALAMLDRVVNAATIDPRPVAARAARVTADLLGDAAGVYERRAPGEEPVATHVAHCDPVREVDAVTIARDAHSSIPFAEMVLDSHQTMFMPQVPQQEVRTYLRPEMHQGLEWIGCYSTICAPIVVGGRADGALLAIRDAPGRPYTFDDVEFVEAIASRIAVGYERVARVSNAWHTRRRVLSAFAQHATRSSEDADELTVAVLLDPA